jgi:hypothetical protein
MLQSCTPARVTLAVLALGLAVLAPVAGEPQPDALPAFEPDKPLAEPERTERLARVKPGMSPDQVRHLLGPPGRSARQILYHRAREQWVYEAPFSVRLEFEYIRGQEPRLLSVQPTAAGKP